MSYPIQVEPQEEVPFLYNEIHTSMQLPGSRGLPRSSISTGRAQRRKEARQKVNDRIWPLHLLHTVVWLATLFAVFIAGWKTSSQMALARNWKDKAAVSRRWMPNRDFDPVMGQRTDVSDAAWDTMHSRELGPQQKAAKRSGNGSAPLLCPIPRITVTADLGRLCRHRRPSQRGLSSVILRARIRER